MGRKADPRGKDRPRTVVLSGDVAEIAQDLADKSQLSAVLSQLLRQSYGISDDISRLEQLLTSTTDERKQLQEREEQIIAEIEAARDQLIHRQNHILPSLYQRQGALEARSQELREKARRALSVENEQRYLRQLEETQRLLTTTLDEIKELEA